MRVVGVYDGHHGRLRRPLPGDHRRAVHRGGLDGRRHRDGRSGHCLRGHVDDRQVQREREDDQRERVERD